ncbi:MAG: agmatine deiminase family protein [Bacteroidales bacterium]|nr:agmatine deiminase family protein [Bacteroidales bacterium]
MDPHLSFPAEWYPQSGIQLTWPHAGTDWAYILDEVEECYINIAEEIAERELLLIVTPDANAVMSKISNRVNISNVRFFETPTNDTWARDHGAITCIKDNIPQIYDFKFNGWGLKFASNLDNLISGALAENNVLKGKYINRLNFVVEGGALESDGEGTLLTTSECLLSKNRNGEFSKEQIELYLKEAFNLKRVLWLDHGYLAGDDTDSHIDTLARFCSKDTIAYVKYDDALDEHYEALSAMENQLRNFVTIEGKPYNLIPLPMADAVYFDDERLPATYANFLIMNEAVLYPTYNQPQKDKEARIALSLAFPGKEIIGIDCSSLIKQHGSLHCVTMQYPVGVLE